MTTQASIEWCQKQLSDLSTRLLRQGYGPDRLEYLAQTAPEFREQFHGTLSQLNRIMDNMAGNPDGYHHYDDFTKAKMDFLRYTNFNRERFLKLGLAETA